MHDIASLNHPVSLFPVLLEIGPITQRQECPFTQSKYTEVLAGRPEVLVWFQYSRVSYEHSTFI